MLGDLELILCEEVALAIVEQPSVGEVDAPLSTISGCRCVSVRINASVFFDDGGSCYRNRFKRCTGLPGAYSDITGMRIAIRDGDAQDKLFVVVVGLVRKVTEQGCIVKCQGCFT